MVEWMSDMDPIHAHPDCMNHAVGTALKAGTLDGFRAAVCLTHTFGYPADQKLVALLGEIVSAIPSALREVTREWVVKTGYRIPCKAGDDIAWIGTDAMPREGRVSHVAREMATAYVIVGDLSDPSSLAPEDEDGEPLPHVRVLGESIFANVSQAIYDLEAPVLGATYEPGVVAQAVEQAEAEFAARGQATAPAPQGQSVEGQSVGGFVVPLLGQSGHQAHRGGSVVNFVPKPRDRSSETRTTSATLVPFIKASEPKPTAPTIAIDDPKTLVVRAPFRRAGDPPPTVVVAPNGDMVIDAGRRIIERCTVKTPVKDNGSSDGPDAA